jgi:exosortase
MMKKGKKAGTEWKFNAVSLLFLVLSALLVYSQMFSRLKLYIDDADPYSYGAVIPPMFLIMIVFFYRKDLKVEKDVKKLLLALPFLALAALLLLGSSSTYGLDALSLPFFIAGAILLLFSIPTFRKLLFPIIYLFLLWTPLFKPLISLQPALTNFTSDVVGTAVRLMGLQIERAGNIFYSGSKISLEIVPECVPLSALIALFCFILPFAYVAVGEKKNRVAWLLAWVIGGWVLNSLRIVVVLLLWYYAGISLALQVFHSVGGNIIFDIVLVASLLSLSLFRIELPL